MIKNNRKTLSILALLLLTFVLVGAVSATDTVSDDTSDPIADTSASDYSDNVQVDDNYKSIEKIDKETSTKGASQTLNANDYSELKEAVQTAKDSENDDLSYIISLSQGGTYTVDETIKWRASPNPLLTIEGNGATITGDAKQFFTISKQNSLIINNIIIEGTSADNGSVINSNGTLTITNSIIRNAQANYGGAIYSTGTVNLQNVTFEANEAVYRGGAIYSTGTLNVNNTTFTYNKMTTHQGAGSRDYGGGAICALGELTLNNSVFDSNLAAHNDIEPNGDGGVAGAILILNNTADITIVNSNFTKNSGRHGGAITILDNLHRDEGTVLIDNNNFVENDALFGGAIDTYHSAIITNNNFTNNYIDGQGSANRIPMGAAICANNGGDPDYTITLENNTFIGNEARENGCGGAVFTMPDTTLNSNNNTYKNNVANEAGVIYNQGSFTSTNDTVKGNTANDTAGVANYGDATFTDGVFEDNTGLKYTGVFTEYSNGSLVIDNCTFANNEGNGYGDILYAFGDVTIEDSTITCDNDYDFAIVRNDAVITANNNEINGTTVDGGLVVTHIVEIENITTVIYDDKTVKVVVKTSDDTIVKKGSIEVLIGDKVISTDCYATNNGFEVTINVDEILENQVITVNYYDPNGLYVPSQTTANLTVDKILATINADDDTATATVEKAVPFTVTYDDTILEQGTVTVIEVDENGEALIGATVQTIDLSTDDMEFKVTLNEGTHYFNISYTDDIYQADTKVITVTASKVAATINADNVQAIATEDTEVPFTVTSGDEVLTQGIVTLKAVNANGEAILGTADQIIDLSEAQPVFTVNVYEGTYYYNLSYEDDKYTAEPITITVTANKVDATIVSEDAFTGIIDENIPLAVSITSGETPVTQGTITILEDGVELNSTEVTGETTTITVSYPELGTHTVTIRYEDEKYEAVDKTVTVTVNKIPTTVSVENQTVKVDDEVTITATVVDVNNNPVTTGTVQFKDADGNILKQVILSNGEEPVYSYTASDAITEEFTIIYKENPTYVGSSTTATVTVNKYETTITVNSPTVNVDDEVTITATLVDENNNPVTVGRVQFKDGVGNVVKTVNLANGDELVYTYTSSEAGVEEITVTYVGTYKYATDTAVSTVTTNKIDASINTDADEYSDLFGEDIPVTIRIVDDEGNAITQGTISISEDGEVIATITITGEESVYNANYPQVGAHTLVISYDNYKYRAEDVEVDVLAEAREATIITEDFDGFVGDHVVITAYVESDGAEVTEGTIRFTNLEGEVLAECDLSNGQASYDFGIINDEFYDEITIEFINSDNYVADSEIITVELIRKYADIELTATEAAIGTPITVTATVTYEDEPVTEGQVVFTDAEGNVIDTINIVDGKASITVTYDQPGTYTINAEMADPAYVSESSIDITINKIPVTIAVSEDQTLAVGQTATITATITSQSGVVNGGKVIFTKGTTKLGEIDVVEGSASIDYTPTTSGETTITAKYVPDDIYSIEEDTASCTVTADKIATTTTLDDVTLTAGKTVTLTARITASDNSIVTEGKVAFKVNGKTLKDANGKVIYVKVVNGVATCDYEVPSDLVGKNVTIEAVYSGSNKYLKSNDKPADPTTVLSGVADIEITSAATVTKGETVTFTVKVTDNGANVNGGKVVLKINGKTLKNADGKVIYANVVDGIASVEYTIPENMKSKDYTLSAVFTSSNYERCETNQTITVQ